MNMKLKLLFFMSLFCVFFNTMYAQSVLIIYDDSPTNVNTLSLKSALENKGYMVTISSVSESLWTNPSDELSGKDVVIHLNGTTYDTPMPVAGQNALVDFVKNKNGLYVGTEWNAYEASGMAAMRDLILFDRAGGDTGSVTYTDAVGQSGHPVLANVPSSFSFAASYNVGSIHTFAVQPALVLMTAGTDDALAIRDFGTGKVLNFNHAGNYNNDTAWSDVNIQQIIIDL